MIARLLFSVFTLLVGLTIVWAGLAFIVGLFVVIVGQMVGMAAKPKGWLFVMCFFPLLLFSQKGRKRIADVLKNFN